MSGSAKANVKTHNQHGNFTVQSTDHIKNVQLTTTHYLMQCSHCNWRGWVIKELIDND